MYIHATRSSKNEPTTLLLPLGAVLFDAPFFYAYVIVERDVRSYIHRVQVVSYLVIIIVIVFVGVVLVAIEREGTKPFRLVCSIKKRRRRRSE